MLLTASNQSLIVGQEKCHLTTDTASASGSITVDNTSGFASLKYILIGNFGEPTAEIILTGTVTAPSTIALASNTVYDHYVDTPVTLINFNQAEFYRTTTLAGTKVLLGSATSISADRTETVYNDLTNSTGYAFFRFKNSTTAAVSDYSPGVNYTGSADNSVLALVEEGCNLAGEKIGGDYTSESQLLADAKEAQNYILGLRDWSFELIKDDTSLTTTENENKYDLSDLTYDLKYPDSVEGILNIKFKNNVLKHIDIDEMEENFEDIAETTLNGDTLADATSITLTDSYEFAETGTVYLGSDVITYTANAQSTGVLSGCTGVDSAHTSGDSVWQGITPGEPEEYSIFDGQIILNVPIDTDYVGMKLKIKYLKKTTPFDDFEDTTDIPFYEAISYYIASKIERRKRNFDEADRQKVEFDRIVSTNMNRYKLQSLDDTEYYTFPTY